MKTSRISGQLSTPAGPSSVSVEFGETIISVTQIPQDDSLPVLSSGLVDTHSHGLLGLSVGSDPNTLLSIAESAVQFGVTRTVLSLVSSDPETTTAVLKAADKVLGTSGFHGIHLEGPYLAEERCGAHSLDSLRSATDQELRDLVSSPSLTSITVAPERAQLEQIKMLSEHCLVAIGHTDADFEMAKGYFDAGATVLTHALNAMRPLLSREPGPLGAAIVSGAAVEVIADGHHLHPATVELIFQATERPILVTDSISAAGQGDQVLSLGDVRVRVQDGVARRIDNGALAGSTLTLNNAVRNCIAWGIEPWRVFEAASSTPASCYGIGDLGIHVGAIADLVLWSDFEPVTVFRAGELVHGSAVNQ